MYSLSKLIQMGVKLRGNNIFINKSVKIYNPKLLTIGNNVRIDNFTILSGSGPINIGSYVHISSNCFITSSKGINIGNFCGISSGVKVFGSNDDYSGKYLFGPTVPNDYKNIDTGYINMEDYSIIGANSIVLPNVNLNEGCIVGALSLVKKSLDPWKIYAGNPLKFIKERYKDCKKIGVSLLNDEQRKGKTN